MNWVQFSSKDCPESGWPNSSDARVYTWESKVNVTASSQTLYITQKYSFNCAPVQQQWNDTIASLPTKNMEMHVLQLQSWLMTIRTKVHLVILWDWALLSSHTWKTSAISSVQIYRLDQLIPTYCVSFWVGVLPVAACRTMWFNACPQWFYLYHSQGWLVRS